MPSGFLLHYVGQGGVLDFGDCPLGHPLTHALPIENTGNTTLHISAVVLTVTSGSTGDITLGGFSSSLSIAPGSIDESILVTFNSSASPGTPISATLVFTSDAVSGTQSFVLQGVGRFLGSVTNYASTTGGSTESSFSTSQGVTNTSTSSIMTWAPHVLAPGSHVSINITFQSTVTTIGAAGSLIQVFYSTDSGLTWQNLYGTASTVPLTNVSANPTLLADLAHLQIKFTVSSTNYFGTATSSATATVGSPSVSESLTGDTFLNYTVWDGIRPHGYFPYLDFGTGHIGEAMSMGAFHLWVGNPTVDAVSLTLAALDTAGFSIAAQSIPDPITIPSLGSLEITPALTPIKGGVQDFYNSYTLTVTGPTTGPVYNVEAYYTTPGFTPAFTLSGTDEESVLALSTGALWQFDTSLPVEDLVFWSRQYYVDSPHLVKILNRLWLMYKAQSTAPPAIRLYAGFFQPHDMTLSSDLKTLWSGVGDRNAISAFDVQQTSSCLGIAFSMDADQGTLQIIGWLLKLDLGGEIIEGT